MGKVNLINFITSINENRFLILYPQSFHSYNIASFLLVIPQMVGVNILITTDNFQDINAVLSNPLPEDLFINYNDIKNDPIVGEINDNSGIILIDDLSKYYSTGLSSYLQGYKNIKVICLTIGDTEILEKWVFLTMSIYDEGPVLNYELKLSSNKNKDVVNFALSHIHSKNISISAEKIVDISNLLTFSIDTKFDPTTDIEYVHILEIEESLFDNLLRLIYKRNLFSEHISACTFIFYVDDKDEPECRRYTNIVDKIESHNKNYLALLKQSIPIKYDVATGVYVTIS